MKHHHAWKKLFNTVKALGEEHGHIQERLAMAWDCYGSRKMSTNLRHMSWKFRQQSL